METSEQRNRGLEDDFNRAMHDFGSGVAIISTLADFGGAGFAAASVAPVTNDPPALLVCLKQSTDIHSLLLLEGCLINVNLLSRQRSVSSNVFEVAVGSERHLGVGRLSFDTYGLPTLEEAMTSLTCRVETAMSYQSHTIFIARVLAVDIRDHVGFTREQEV